jgi:hypothetical protein
MKTAKVNNAIVIENETLPTRWLDIFGECQKFDLGNGFPTDDTTGDPTQFTMTVTEAGAGNTTAVNSTVATESMLITTAANEYDGINLQLKGEQFKLTASKPFYTGVKLKINDADQTDLLVGLAETDTALLATGTAHATDYGTTDVLGFLSLDAVATITTQTVTNGVVVGSAVSDTSLVDDTYVTLEMYWDGETLHYYTDGVLDTSTSGSLPPGDLTPTINFRTGEAVANTCRIAWWRAFQAN